MGCPFFMSDSQSFFSFARRWIVCPVFWLTYLAHFFHSPVWHIPSGTVWSSSWMMVFCRDFSGLLSVCPEISM